MPKNNSPHPAQQQADERHGIVARWRPAKELEAEQRRELDGSQYRGHRELEPADA